MQKIERAAPVRVSFAAAEILLFVITMLMIGMYDLPADEVIKGFMYVSGVVVTLIVGDTYRPSGHVSGHLSTSEE
jgi:hypothetical protein